MINWLMIKLGLRKAQPAEHQERHAFSASTMSDEVLRECHAAYERKLDEARKREAAIETLRRGAATREAEEEKILAHFPRGKEFDFLGVRMRVTGAKKTDPLSMPTYTRENGFNSPMRVTCLYVDNDRAFQNFSFDRQACEDLIKEWGETLDGEDQEEGHA